MRKISIITVNFNQPVVTIALLNSIKQHAGAFPIEVILVDNAPKQDYEPIFKAAFNNLIYTRSEINAGFAGGNNLGIRQAEGDYILLLNNDTEITSGFLQTLVSELDANPSIGLLSPLIKFYDNKNLIQYAGFSEMNYFTGRNSGIGFNEEDKGQYNKTYQTGYCHGAAVICRKEDLEKAGLMEEHYFLYYEELDWCEKFKRIGKQIWFTGKTFLYHKESASVGVLSPLKIYFMTRNRMLFIRRNGSFLSKLVFGTYYSFIVCPKDALKYAVSGHSELSKQVFRGLLWNFTNTKNSTKLGYKIK